MTVGNDSIIFVNSCGPGQSGSADEIRKQTREASRKSRHTAIAEHRPTLWVGQVKERVKSTSAPESPFGKYPVPCGLDFPVLPANHAIQRGFPNQPTSQLQVRCAPR